MGEWPVTVAVNITGWLYTDGFTDELTAVVEVVQLGDIVIEPETGLRGDDEFDRLFAPFSIAGSFIATGPDEDLMPDIELEPLACDDIRFEEVDATIESPFAGV